MGARTWTAALLGWMVVVGGLAPAEAEVGERPVRIALVGDSITHGSSGDWTWRYFLHRHLAAGGLAFDLVGSRSGVHDHEGDDHDDTTTPQGSQAYADPAFDTDHQSRWGKSVTMSPGVVPDLMRDHEPDVLVHALGFNDLTWLRLEPHQLLDAVHRQVQEARAANPSVRVVLAQAMVDVDHWSHFPVADYNTLLLQTAPGWSTTESPVVVATVPAGYRSTGTDRERDTWDGVHPDTSGQVKIAARIADALGEVGVGAGASATVPVPLEGLRSGSVLTLHPAHDQDPRTAVLRWSGPPGATGHDVWTSVDDGPWVELATGVASDYTVSGLAPGHTHSFRVVARKYDVRSADDQFSIAVVLRVPPDPSDPSDPSDPGEPEDPATPVLAVSGFTLATGVKRAVVAWDPVEAAVGYRVEWRRRGAEAWRSKVVADPGTTLRGLVAGAVHDVRVSALTPHGVSRAVGGAVRVRGPRLAAVRRVEARVARGHVRLSWRAVARATHYRVERREQGTWVPVRASVRGTRVRLRLPVGRQQVRVRAQHQEWAGPPSARVVVRVR